MQLHSDLGVPYLAEHIRSIAQSVYSTFPNVENPLVRQLEWYLAYSRDVWKLFKICTRIQNSISAFSPDGVSLIVEAFSWNDPNCWTHNPEVSKPNTVAIRIKAPFVLFWSEFSVVFPGCKANARRVTPKGPWTDFAKKTLATQGCGRTVKFCLCPALRLWEQLSSFQWCVSYAGMEAAWRTSSLVLCTWDSASGSLLWSWS